MNITHTNYGIDGSIQNSRSLSLTAPADYAFTVESEGVRISYTPADKQARKKKNRQAKAGRRASRK